VEIECPATLAFITVLRKIFVTVSSRSVV